MKKKLISILIVLVILTSSFVVSMAAPSVGAKPVTLYQLSSGLITSTDSILKNHYIIYRINTNGYWLLVTSNTDVSNSITVSSGGTNITLSILSGQTAYALAPNGTSWSSGWGIYTGGTSVTFTSLEWSKGNFLLDSDIVSTAEPAIYTWYDTNTSQYVNFNLFNKGDWSYWNLRFIGKAEVQRAEQIAKLESAFGSINTTNGTLTTTNGFLQTVSDKITSLWNEFNSWQSKLITSLGTAFSSAFDTMKTNIGYSWNALSNLTSTLTSGIQNFFLLMFDVGTNIDIIEDRLESAVDQLNESVPIIHTVGIELQYLYDAILESTEGDAIINVPEVREPYSNMLLMSSRQVNFNQIVTDFNLTTYYQFYITFINVVLIMLTINFILQRARSALDDKIIERGGQS